MNFSDKSEFDENLALLIWGITGIKPNNSFSESRDLSSKGNSLDVQNSLTSNSNKTKVLIVFANPRSTDSLRLGSEDRAIHQAIQLSQHRNNILLTICHAATIHDLRRSLLNEEFQIVHISGHGIEDGLVLEDEVGREQIIPRAALADLLQSYSPPIQCVILNACYSSLQGKLTSLGVPFAIAMEGPLSDESAIEFARGFYDAIGAGKTFEFAYEEGKRTSKLVAPNTSFVSQLFKRDHPPKHFLFRTEGDIFLKGDYIRLDLSSYLTIEIDQNNTVAMRPSSYRSLRLMLDDLYICYLTDTYEPFSYGKDWILVNENSPAIVTAPWSWLLPPNRNRSISEFDSRWFNRPLTACRLYEGTQWKILNIGKQSIPMFGIASNHPEFSLYLHRRRASSEAELLREIFSTKSKMLVELYLDEFIQGIDKGQDNADLDYIGHLKLVSPATISSRKYRYLLIFTYPSARLDGKAAILE